ncbi:MAG: hypothetical protein WBA67_10435 [Jannaschia sp.]
MTRVPDIRYIDLDTMIDILAQALDDRTTRETAARKPQATPDARTADTARRRA